ncbi:MAG: hypothetical protein WC005_09625 [Candidatus Nanopelagicales bacterium]
MKRTHLEVLLRVRRVREREALRTLAEQQRALLAADLQLSTAVASLESAHLPASSDLAEFRAHLASRAAKSARVGLARTIVASRSADEESARHLWLVSEQDCDVANRLIARQREHERAESDRRERRANDDLALALHGRNEPEPMLRRGTP